MDPRGDAYGYNYGAISLSVKNMSSGRVYRVALNQQRGIIELPVGTYCLNDVDNRFFYCGQPLFDIRAGEVGNAGYFVMAVDNQNGKYKLSEAFSNPTKLESGLSIDQKKVIAAFRTEHQKEH